MHLNPIDCDKLSKTKTLHYAVFTIYHNYRGVKMSATVLSRTLN